MKICITAVRLEQAGGRLYYSKLYLISICTKLYLMQSLDGKIPTTSSRNEMEGRVALSSHQVLGCKIPRVENRAKD